MNKSADKCKQFVTGVNLKTWNKSKWQTDMVAQGPGGRPRGKKMLKTLEKEQAREYVRQVVTARLGSLLEAQLDNAEGTRHLMMRDPKTGQFERITGGVEQIDEALKSNNACWIYTKDPSVQAFTDLLNRALDKGAEHVSIAGADGGPIQIQWMRPDEEETLESNSKELSMSLAPVSRPTAILKLMNPKPDRKNPARAPGTNTFYPGQEDSVGWCPIGTRPTEMCPRGHFGQRHRHSSG